MNLTNWPAMSFGMRPSRKMAWGLLMLVSATATGIRAAEYVVPTNGAAAYGNTGTSYPCLSSACRRYQQVYAASEFASAQSPQLITRLGFRYRTATSTFYLSGTWMEVRLSTTSRNPDGLSATFADNPGADETLVYAGTNWQFAGSSALGKFWMDAYFDRPFHYDRTKGNLLVEIRMPGYYNFSGYTLDATNAASDSVSRLYASATNAAAGTLDSVGAITEFTFQDVVLSNISAEAVAGGIVLRHASISNAEYRVQVSTNLAGAFANASAIYTASPPFNVVTQFPGSGLKFYRVVREK
ncbi:MAG TPA: hypothetical protein P5567_08635 [Kiritimatiellia bacterium]|nr:hypothetical protein [Kiritimatiellia bacterium]HRZ12508.1 hypothetical protein [Kiritimatiellia bacterium]HSA17734.1 hypothetical protein [Kiritimatiellia bacterium]